MSVDGKLSLLEKLVGEIQHPVVWVEDRGFWADVDVLPVLELLWTAGIETFYSCQGGPKWRSRNGRTISLQAYVQVRETDVERVCELLAHLNPIVDIHPNRRHTNVAIRWWPKV